MHSVRYLSFPLTHALSFYNNSSTHNHKYTLLTGTGISAPSDGSMGTCTTSTLLSGESCTFECTSGYTLSGNTTCTDDGVLTLGICEQDCDTSQQGLSIDPANGNMGTCTGTIQSGLSCSYVCNTGFSVSSASTCIDGVFDVIGECLRDCTVSAPSDGSLGTCSSSMTSGTSCT
jgi:hypothetical protein